MAIQRMPLGHKKRGEATRAGRPDLRGERERFLRWHRTRGAGGSNGRAILRGSAPTQPSDSAGRAVFNRTPAGVAGWATRRG